ncbi:MAG: hypothetical protein P8099_07480 [Gemmatimonadota bacterium]|jgi:hypothetical protein
MGVLLAITSDSITFESPNGLEPISYALADVSTIEEKTESYTSRRTLLITMSVMSVTGAVVGVVGGASCNGEFLCPGPVAGLAVGALAGAVVGLPLGLVLWPIIRYSRWEPVSKPLSPPAVGLGLALKIPLPAW